jgi:hypothetical protein
MIIIMMLSPVCLHFLVETTFVSNVNQDMIIRQDIDVITPAFVVIMYTKKVQKIGNLVLIVDVVL